MGKQFHISVVLCITTGKLLAHSKCGYEYPLEAVYDILNYITGEKLYTHQLPRVCDEAAPVILAEYPALANIVVPDFDKDQLGQWQLEGNDIQKALDYWIDERVVPTYGEYLDIYPMHADDHEVIDPVVEAGELVGEDKVITFTPPDDDISPIGDIGWS